MPLNCVNALSARGAPTAINLLSGEIATLAPYPEFMSASCSGSKIAPAEYVKLSAFLISKDTLPILVVN